jgi:hypothetical protein
VIPMPIVTTAKTAAHTTSFLAIIISEVNFVLENNQALHNL